MAAQRTAAAVWEGSLVTGHGMVSATSSSLFKELPVTWASRTEQADGRTSPEELIAAAHASCFAMALSGQLARAKTPPQHLEVNATVTFDQVNGDWTVVSSALVVRGRVRGMDAEAFRKAAENAKDGCPVSRALTGNVKLSVEATLVQ